MSSASICLWLSFPAKVIRDLITHRSLMKVRCGVILSIICHHSRWFHGSISSPSILIYDAKLFSFFKSCNYGLHVQWRISTNVRWCGWERELATRQGPRSWCFWKQPQCRHYLWSSTLFLPAISFDPRPNKLVWLNPLDGIWIQMF